MNLSRIVQRWADFQPTKTAIHFDGADISYAELWQRVDAATLRLAGLGVHRSDRVAWLGFSHPEMIACLLACARLGALLVPLNFRLAVPEHRGILEHAEASVLVVEPDFFAHARELATALPLLKIVGLGDAPAEWFAWSGALPQGFEPKMAGADDDEVLIVYTSGTTGRPKGAVHTQAGLIWNAIMSSHAHDLTADDHILTALPLFHVGGLCIQTLPTLHAGGTVTLHARFDPARWLADVAARRPTMSLLVPATMKAIIEHPAFAQTDLSSLRLINSGSSTIPAALINAFHARGVPVTQVYGTTETGPISIYLRREDALRKVGSAGKVGLHCEVRLVDADGNDVPGGRIGEIWVRGLNVMRRYWKDADNPAFRDGWFRTGDLASRDHDGFYKVVGRSKDMIISGGENVYPAELENVLADCGDVLEAAVVGMADAQWGEVAVAAIVKRAGCTLDEAAVRALFEGRLARYKHPRRIVFLDALPKNAMGKVQKFELRQRLA